MGSLLPPCDDGLAAVEQTDALGEEQQAGLDSLKRCQAIPNVQAVPNSQAIATGQPIVRTNS